jgi:ERCC4-type nuclease
VDVHEPMYLRALADEVKEIPVDVIVVGSERKYMVERKEVMDLWKSVQDGRLWRQLKYLEDSRNEGYVPILLIEGSLGKLFRFAGTMTIRKFMGLQLAFSSFGVAVVQLSPKMVKPFIKFLNEKADKKRRFDRPNIPKPIERTLDEERVDVLRAIRGIGDKTADELLKRFTTVAGVVNAPDGELYDVLGKKAEHFIEVVRGVYNGRN